MNIKKYLLAAFIFTLSSQALAYGYITGHGYGIDIEKFHVHNGGGITLWVDSSRMMNPDNCTHKDKVFISASDEGYDVAVSVVLAAYMGGKKIGFWSPGCTTLPFWGGTNTYPRANNIWISDNLQPVVPNN